MRASNARPYGVDCTSDENVGATIGRPLLPQGQFALTLLPIHLLRLLGYDTADKTVFAALPAGTASVGSFGYFRCRKDKAA